MSDVAAPAKLAVRTVKTGDLTLDPTNARKHGPRNLSAIKESLARFGQRRPIVVTSDLVVVAGNGTLEAARELGWRSISVTVIPPDWTLEQVRAYALADNRTGELAAWNEDLLDEQLVELDAAGWDMAALGFENPAGGAGADLDEVPDVGKPRAKVGDRWILGAHRLVCGSATDPEAVGLALGEDKLNAVLTDPPYGVEYVGKAKSTGTTIANDDLGDEGLRRLVEESLSLARHRAIAGAPIYLFHAEKARVAFQTALEGAGWRHAQTLIWVKDRFVLGRVDYHYQHEPILYGWKPGAAHRWFGSRDKTTILEFDEPPFQQIGDQEWQIALGETTLIVRGENVTVEPARGTVFYENKPTASAEHPTMKPVRLIARMLANSAKRGAVVLDPFGGSGSTLMAADALGLEARLVELDPRFVDVIVWRWQEATGGIARLAGEKPFAAVASERGVEN